LEDVPLTEVIKKRDIILTDKPFPMWSFRDRTVPTYIIGKSEEEQKHAIFHQGPLICRKVWTSIRYAGGKVYASIIRDVFPSESVTAQKTMNPMSHGASCTPQPNVSRAGEPASAGARKRQASRTPSLEELSSFIKSKRHPVKTERYTMLDICCGAGGASRGGVQADIHLAGGVDMDELAIEAWQANFPEGIALNVNIHDICRFHRDIFGRVDILWLSIPCQPYSPNQ
jgi:DNA (cytosine-5)-methyltransferase 1